MTTPYTYDERILVQDDTVRLESFMAYGGGGGGGSSDYSSRRLLVHPFGKLQQALEMDDDEDSSSSSYRTSMIRRVTMSVASRSSQSFSLSTHDNDSDDSILLQSIPLLDGAHADASDPTRMSGFLLPQFPSGFWLEILAERSLTLSELDSLVDHWRDKRVITTPTQGSVWDREKLHNEQQPKVLYRHQLFLPTIGAAWSADAWQQTMQALLPSSCCSGSGSNYTSPSDDDSTSWFFGVSAMDWSKLLVDGPTTNKQFWIQWTPHQHACNIGLQFQSNTNYIKKDDSNNNSNSNNTSDNVLLPPTLFSEEASSPLATRSIQRLPSSRSAGTASTTTTTTLEQVLRRPAVSPNHGRLETWFTSSSSLSSTSSLQPHQDCQLKLRQKLPYFMAPQWQSLKIITTKDDTDFQTFVEWDDSDLSAILQITSPASSHSNIPSSLIISLDYEPVLLSLDDFPGDPNRGRELPPAVATLTCRGNTTSTDILLYSNAVLLLPPVPDMSMPFNVLSLSCSLYAYLIGTIVTLLVKRSSERIKYRLHPELKPPSKLRQLKSKILSKFQGRLSRSPPSKEDTNVESEKKQEGADDNDNNDNSNEKKGTVQSATGDNDVQSDE